MIANYNVLLETMLKQIHKRQKQQRKTKAEEQEGTMTIIVGDDRLL